MTSKLTKEEFEIHLTRLTKSGDPVIMGTPFAMFAFNNSSRPFYGEITTSGFRLTKNTTFLPTPFTITGTFRESGTGTEVDYEVKPIWFGYLWIRILPVFAFVLMNFLLIKLTNQIVFEVMIPLNIALIFMFLPILITNRLKRKMEKDFIESFELGTY